MKFNDEEIDGLAHIALTEDLLTPLYKLFGYALQKQQQILIDSQSTDEKEILKLKLKLLGAQDALQSVRSFLEDLRRPSKK